MYPLVYLQALIFATVCLSYTDKFWHDGRQRCGVIIYWRNYNWLASVPHCACQSGKKFKNGMIREIHHY